MFEYATGHRMKTPLSCFGEAILWRAKRHAGALNKYDSEWSDGIFLGIEGMGVSVLVGTPNGIRKTTDFRMAPEGRWNAKLVVQFSVPFAEFVLPSSMGSDEAIDIEAPVVMPEGAPAAADEITNTTD